MQRSDVFYTTNEYISFFFLLQRGGSHRNLSEKRTVIGISPGRTNHGPLRLQSSTCASKTEYRTYALIGIDKSYSTTHQSKAKMDTQEAALDSSGDTGRKGSCKWRLCCLTWLPDMVAYYREGSG